MNLPYDPFGGSVETTTVRIMWAISLSCGKLIFDGLYLRVFMTHHLKVPTRLVSFRQFALTLIGLLLSSPAHSQNVTAPADSGIPTALMRVQPLDDAATPSFIGGWEPFDDGSWLSFDLDFTTGTEAVALDEARVTYRDAGGANVASATVGPRDLSFATLNRTDVATGTTLPATFNETGGRLDDLGSFGMQCISDIEIDSNQLLYAGGTGTSAPIFPATGVFPNGSLLARYNNAGSTDSGFSGNGLLALQIDHPFNEDDTIRHGIDAIAITPGGDIWTAGVSWLENVPQDGAVDSFWTLTRIDVNGDTDLPFGVRIVEPQTDGGAVLALTVDSSSRPVAAGYIRVDDQARATLATFDLGGDLSGDFGLRVASVLPENTVSTYTGLAYDSSDRLYATGWFGPPQELEPEPGPLEDRTWFVARFADDGTLDESFGTDGLVEVDFLGFDRAKPSAIVIDDQDRIVTVGSVSTGDGINFQAAFSRLLPSGAPDDTFQPLFSGTGQFVTDAGFGGLIWATDAEIDSQGRIAASLATSEEAFVVIRLEGADGTVDATFGEDGVAAHEHPDTASQEGNFASSIALAAGNRIVLGGCATADGERNFALMRLLDDGSLDSNANQLPASTRVILAFPDEALPDAERQMPFDGTPPATVDVELDLREVASGEVWTITWTDIPAPNFVPVSLPDPTQSYILPLAPAQVVVPLPDDDACALIDDDDVGEDEIAPPAPELFYLVSGGHELRFGDVETAHRHLVQSLNVPSASNDQRHAYDFVMRDQEGNGNVGLDAACEPIDISTNETAYIWGQSVIAAADGNIVTLDNSQPDNPSPGIRLAGVPRGGNSVTIDHLNGQFTRYSHLQAGSIPNNLAALDAFGICPAGGVCTVSQGDILGLVGNSGNSSGPHLHFVLMDGSNANTAEGRPITFSNVLFGMTQTNVALHTGTQIEEVLPIPSMIELNPPSPAGLVTEIEDNDTVETHNAVTPPTTVEGEISDAENPTLAVRGDPMEDIYRFETETRAQVVIRVTPTSLVGDLDVYLLNDGLLMLNPDGAGWGDGSNEEIVATLAPGRYYVAVSDVDDGDGATYDLDIELKPFAWQYPAKIVCGMQPDPEDGRLTPGRYATTVNIHNPGATPALVNKTLALAYPPVEQTPGQIVEIGEDDLGYNQAVKTDCDDIRLNALSETTLGVASYYEGFVVIESTERLDVTAVYSTAALDSSGSVGPHSSIDVEQINERGLGVDLSVRKTAEDFVLHVGDRPLHFILYTVDIGNLGPATANDVHLVDEMSLSLLNAEGIVGLLPFPLDLPATGTLLSIDYPSLTESVANFDVGSIAAGTTRTIRFWGVAVAAGGEDGSPAFAVVENRATIRAGPVELLEDDNTATDNTQILP